MNSCVLQQLKFLHPTSCRNGLQISRNSLFHRSIKNYYHRSASSLSVNSSSNDIKRVQYFNHNEALYFIISSKIDDGEEPTASATPPSSSASTPLIYSPALFVSEDEKKDLILQDNNEENSSQQIIDNISSIVESHYTLDSDSDRDQFVGGMGENDGGVWFVADNADVTDDDSDTLDYWEQIRDVISAIKESRHGIPFGVHTSGIMNNKEIATNLKENVGISSVQVTLGSGDPQSYSQVVRKRKDLNSNASFGQVCSFIAQCAESGFPVTAAVAGGKHKASGNELAKALGAVDVEVYDSIQ